MRSASSLSLTVCHPEVWRGRHAGFLASYLPPPSHIATIIALRQNYRGYSLIYALQPGIYPAASALASPLDGSANKSPDNEPSTRNDPNSSPPLESKSHLTYSQNAECLSLAFCSSCNHQLSCSSPLRRALRLAHRFWWLWSRTRVPGILTRQRHCRKRLNLTHAGFPKEVAERVVSSANLALLSLWERKIMDDVF